MMNMTIKNFCSNVNYAVFFLFISLNLFGQDNESKIEKIISGIEVNDISGDEENIWFATNGKGIYKYDLKTNNLSNYSTLLDNLQMDFFYCLTSNKDYVWAGSTDGLFILDKKRDRWSKRKFGKGGQLSNWIRSVEYDPYDNSVWIGRFMYLTKFDMKDKRFYDYDLTQNQNMKTNTIKTVKVDGDSLVWFGTEAGLHKYDKSRSIDYDEALKFYDNSFNYFYGEGESVSISAVLVEQNNLWIGLDEFITADNPEYNLGGLYKFNRKNEWTKFDDKTGLSGNGIFCLERTGKYIWAGIYQFGKNTKDIYGRGLAIINSITNEVKEIRNEILPYTILSLYFDGKNMWVGTDSGAFRIELTNDLTNLNGN